MFPESPPSRNAILGAGVVLAALGLSLILSAAVGRTALAFDLFGFTLGFVSLGLGVTVIIAAVVRSRKR